jgi:hypothetical protein
MTPKLNEFLVFKSGMPWSIEDSPLGAISIWFFSTIVWAIPLKLANYFPRAKWKTDFDASPNDSQRSHVDFISGLGFQHVL